MSWLHKRACSPIGIDLDGRRLRAVQLTGSPKGWQIQAATSVARSKPGSPVSPEEVEAFLRTLPKHGFVGTHVVIAMPGNKVMSSILDLPPRSSGAPVDRIARSELARMHQCDLRAIEVAMWELPAPARAGNTTPTMVCACSYTDAEALLKLFDRCGHHVEAIDSRSQALARACMPMFSDPTAITAVVEIDCDWVNIVVLHESLVAYERVLEGVGTEGLIETLVAKTRLDRPGAEEFLGEVVLDPTTAMSEGSARSRKPITRVEMHFDALADELMTPLAYLESQYPDAHVREVLLTGPGASIEGLADYVGARLEVSVRAVTPTHLADVPETFTDPIDGASTVATGLAQYGPDKVAPSVNLIPSPKLLAMQRRKQTRKWAAACLAYAIMLVAVYAGCRMRWGGNDVQAGELSAVSGEITNYNRQIAAVKNAETALRAKIDANNAVGQQPDWSILLALLARNLGNDVVLKHCELDLDRQDPSSPPSADAGQQKQFVLEVHGLGRTQTAVSAFILRLERVGLFDQVKLIRTRREEFMTGRVVAFQLACTLGAESRRPK